MKLLPKCKCGCGRRVKGKRATYLKGHGTTAAYPCVCKYCGRGFAGSRRDANDCKKCRTKYKKCKCGCGGLTKTTYISGHNLRRDLPEKVCSKCKRKFSPMAGNAKQCAKCRAFRKCLCGCGKYTRTIGASYRSGHAPRKFEKRICKRCKAKYTPTSGYSYQCHKCAKPKPCACGCGSMVKTSSLGSLYVRAHHPTYQTSAFRAEQSHRCKAQLGRKSSAEALLEKQLDARIFRYTGLDNARGKGKYGQPISSDFTVASVKLIVQVDGCYWHGCPRHGQKEEVRNKQIARDKTLTKVARRKGWNVIRVWEHDIKKNAAKVASRVTAFYRKIKTSLG